MGLAEEYLDQMRRDRLAPGTLAQKRRMLSSLPSNPENLTREEFEDWWRSFQYKADGSLKAAKTVASELSHLNSFYAWALRKRRLVFNPADGVDSPKTGKSRPDPIREKVLASAFAAADPLMARMLALAAFAGLRSAEIANLRWEDVDPDSRLLMVRHGKGDKDRSIPFDDVLAKFLGEPTSDFVVNVQGHCLSPKAVSARINRHLENQGVDSTAHKLRARFATRALASGGNLILVMKMLGHESVATTQLYTQVSDDEARRVVSSISQVG